MIDGQHATLMALDEVARLPVDEVARFIGPIVTTERSDVRGQVSQVAAYRGDLGQVPCAGQTPVEAVIKLVEPVSSPARRGTTNGAVRGSSTDRRRRREWLVGTWRADVDVLVVELFHGPVFVPVPIGSVGALPACRCYRCGRLLTEATVTVDRVVPGCRGGTYKRDNIRPSCQACASHTGAVLGNERKRGAR